MAVSVRIEDEAFGDRRYDLLAVELGVPDADCARGKMAAIWRQCTQQQTHLLDRKMVCAILGPNGVDALLNSGLGEQNGDLIRIKGTRGRIEWLAKLRKNGRKGGRPRKPNGNHLVLETETRCEPEPNPPAPAPAPAQKIPEEDSDTPSAVGPRVVSSSHGLAELRVKLDASDGGLKQRRKPKPSDPTQSEIASVRAVLEKLSARNGVQYSQSAEHTRLLVNQLRAGVSEMDLRAVVGYCALELGWADKPEMAKYLRPETLFGPKTIARYLDPARTWFSKLPDDPPASNASDAFTEPAWMAGGAR